MRTPSYLSPSSIALADKDMVEFFLKYLSVNKPPNLPQNQAMASGSVFDAHVKAYLHEALFGKGNDPKYSFESLFEAQVEPQNRDWAREHGIYLFEQYKGSGALADLMTELRQASGTPRFEFDVQGAVDGYREPVSKKMGQVVLMGKPDCHFITKQGAHVILDWKVNGYCSPAAHSPKQGYLKLREKGVVSSVMHKRCQPMHHNGFMINIAMHLDDIEKSWAAQLSIYAWLMGEAIGSPFIVAIDQLACDPTKGGFPGVRVAEHRLTVNRKFQEDLFIRAVDLWELVHSDWIFRDMSREQSQARCIALDGVKASLIGDGSPRAAWLASVCRSSF